MTDNSDNVQGPNRIIDGKFRVPARQMTVEEIVAKFRNDARFFGYSIDDCTGDDDDEETTPKEQDIYALDEVDTYLKMPYEDSINKSIVEFEAIIDILDLDIEDITGEVLTVANTEGDLYTDFSAFEAWVIRSGVDVDGFIEKVRQELENLLIEGVANITGEPPVIKNYQKGSK